MDMWIAATLAAAFFQTLRFMLQKHLATAALSAAGATLARFLYSAPLVGLGLGVWLVATSTPLPHLSAAFWAFGALGGLAQILATVCIVALFKSRNFAVGITLKKTEVLQTALIGVVAFGEALSWAGFGAIVLGFVGVLLLGEPAKGGQSWSQRLFSRAMVLGLGSGFMFGISANAYRAASLDLAIDQPLLRAAVTLAAVTMMQTLAMLIWLRARDPGQITQVIQAWRVAMWVGLASLAGSLGWFTAFTLQNAAYVNALGQVELLFSVAVSVLVFREKVSGREIAGIAVLGVSILVLILVL